MRTTSRGLIAIAVGSIALPLSGITVASAEATPSPGQPHSLRALAVDGGPNVTYRDSAGHVHVVRWQHVDAMARAGSGDFDLLGAMGGTRATGTPTGYASSMDPANPLEHI